MKENLKTTKYGNGDQILNITDNTGWISQTEGAYCWYNNDSSKFKNAYGALYNWYAVDDARKLCPAGWHTPTNAEWTTLTTYLGGEDVAGGKLKETGTTHWSSQSPGTDNSSGFTALPSGYRYTDGTFNGIGNSGIGSNGNWWSSSEILTTYAHVRFMHANFNSVSRYYIEKNVGYSVRCIKD